MRPLLLLVLALACSSTPPEAPPNLAAHAHRLDDYTPLMRAIGDAHLVLLGEATHGTHEFYVERAKITQQLITEKKFTGVALEADGSDAERIDRYVRGESTDRSAAEALRGFEDFPRWMWRNQEFADLVEWIRRHNDSLPANEPKVGVYGLDLYGLEESRAALKALASPRNADEQFAKEQHARVVKNAEEYYREEQRGVVSTWNLRDRHMVETMAALQQFLIQRNGRDHIVVWAHNSHVGDARATSRARYNEWNMGQLVREHWPRGASFTVGFTTHTGTVMAASEWGGAPRVQQLRESMRGSHGALLHETGLARFYLILSEIEERAVRTPRQQRAVGVIYLPFQEATAHYFAATLAEQFDAVIHIDETTAVTALP
ncbi:MAG TPA: erythromycin esterase family protein [Thermoanaerobaculia bacterium]|nr:erythromycin esterase family protein [Thermoanaerobaculia bacterium]